MIMIISYFQSPILFSYGIDSITCWFALASRDGEGPEFGGDDCNDSHHHKFVERNRSIVHSTSSLVLLRSLTQRTLT
jgi:hypothetical protein